METVNEGVEVSEVTKETVADTAPSEAPLKADGLEIGDKDGATEAPAYTPDFKFSAYGMEGEIDKDWHQYIKDKKSEESFKKLYSKAHAFEKNHEKLERTRTENEGLVGEVQGYRTGVQELRAHVANDDFDSFFKKLNIPMEKLWGWVEKKIRYQDLSQEEKLRYDETLRLKRENFELQNKYKSTGDTHNQTLSRLANLELDIAISRPEFKQFQESYDAKEGRPGAFRDFVVQTGKAIEAQTQADCSVDEAVKQVVEWCKRWGLGQVETETPQGQTPLVAKSSQKPVIPNIKGGSAAPVKKRPQNLKEFRAFVEQRQSARP